jgi:serine phosphatase RsbU (regulator of sigma subunit)
VIVTDGVAGAVERRSGASGLAGLVEGCFAFDGPVQDIADSILERATEYQEGRPKDDMTVLVLRLGPGVAEQPIRRISYSIPMRS